MDIRIKPLEWEERKTRLGTVWWSAPNPLGGLSIEAASENDKIAAQADYERRILSALELTPLTRPAEQAVTSAEPAAAYTTDYLGCEHVSRDVESIERIAASGAQGPTDVVYLYERPAAVTEAMVEAAVQAVRQYTRETLFIDEHRELVRNALKAAMGAGR